MTNKEAYFLGAYLGDGMCREEYIRKTDGTQAYQASLVVKPEQYKYLEDLLGSRHYNIRQSSTTSEYRTYSTRDREVTNYIVAKCGSSKEKHLPEGLTTTQKWFLLSGFIDTDGNVDSDKVHLMNTNLSIIKGLEKYLISLGIGYTLVTQRTLHKPCYNLSIKAEDLPRTRFTLLISYKKERYLRLKDRSKGRKVWLGEEWFIKNDLLLRRILPKTTRIRRISTKRWYLLESELKKLESLD